jgi:hypothetical protein
MMPWGTKLLPKTTLGKKINLWGDICCDSFGNYFLPHVNARYGGSHLPSLI